MTIKRLWLISVALVGALFDLDTVSAYEIETHADMSRAAVSASILLMDATVMQNLGIKSTEEFPNSKNVGKSTSIVELVRDGSRFEDTLFKVPPRPLNHFYDPLYNRPLTALGFAAGEKSPDWALEDGNGIGGQEFSFKDARDYFYRALTATNEAVRNTNFGLTFQTLGHVIHHVQDMAQPQHVRNDPHCDAWYCVGPFHNPSRYEKYTDDIRDKLPFSDISYNATNPIVFNSPRSFWTTGTGLGLAEFTNSNFVSADTNFRGAFQNGQLIARPNEHYPLPLPASTSPRYEDANSLLASVGTRIPSECLPPNNPCEMAFFSSEVKDSYRPQPGLMNPRASTASIFDQYLQIYGKTASYPNLDNCTDPKNPDTCEKIETSQVFSLNRFNFDEAHKLLIPRAVAYSAGLLDYFFRGKLEAQDAGFTDTGISLRVKNAIDPRTQNHWKDEHLAVGGTLLVTLRYRVPDGTDPTGFAARYFTSVPTTLTEAIRPGRASWNTYKFIGLPDIPADAKDVEYRLVYRGTMGQESNAVAVGAFKPISGFLVTPSYAPADGLSTAGQKRLIYYTQGQWRLSKDTAVQAGNIDWKGWYVNDKPTKVLSWIGPPVRYFPEEEYYDRSSQRWRSYSTFGNAVYQGGELLAGAPGEVLGAAVARDSQGLDWLVVVCADDIADVVYRRPYKKGGSTALYDSLKEPEGWERIGTSSPIQGDPPGSYTQTADIPWFFNGTGTEAQTMRRWWSGNISWSGGLLKRLKLELRDDLKTAVFTIEDRGEQGHITERTCSASYDQYGAGSGQYTSTSRGEYTFAVDYKNNRPVFGKVRIEGSSSRRSTVSVSHDHEPDKHYNDVLTGETAISSNYREFLVWDAGELQIYSDTYTPYTITWTSGATTPTYRRAIDRRSSGHEITYVLDLRGDQYAYYFWNSIDRDVIVDSMEHSTEDLSEGSEFAQGKISEALYTNTYPHYEANRSSYGRSYDTRCDNASNGTIYGYGTSNLGWWSWYNQSLGTVAVDREGRRAYSLRLLADFGYEEAGSANKLSGDGRLESLIPGAPSSGALYYPINVVQ